MRKVIENLAKKQEEELRKEIIELKDKLKNILYILHDFGYIDDEGKFEEL